MKTSRREVFVLLTEQDFHSEVFHPMIYTERKQAEMALKWAKDNATEKHVIRIGYLIDTQVN